MTSDPAPGLGDLSPREEELVEAARRGAALICSGLGTDVLVASNDVAHSVRAELVRDLVLSRYGPLDPRGVQLQGARIVGQLDLDHVSASVGIRLTRCAVADGITARDAHLPWLDLTGSRLNTLVAVHIHVAGSLLLDSVRMTGSCEFGAIRLFGARVGGQLSLDNAEVTNDRGPALSADGLHVGSGIRFDCASLSGIGGLGTITLVSARIDGQLDLDNVEVTNKTAPALAADGVQVDGDLRFNSARLCGAGESGAIRLLGASVGGQLTLISAEVVNDTGVTLALAGATVSGEAVINVELVCSQPMRGVSPCSDPTQVGLDGFTFGGLPQMEWWQWLHVIRCHTTRYRPQPFQQLAAIERTSGHDGHVRQILIAQQQDVYKRAPDSLGSWWARRFHWMWGALAGYGYRVRRTGAVLLLALVLAGVLGLWAGQVVTGDGHHAAERTATFTRPEGQSCSSVELIGVGIDRGLPLSPTGVRARCDLNTGTMWGGIFTVAIWLVQATVWGLATLALAGYVGLIRRTN